MYMFYKGKKSARWRIEPRTSHRDSSHLNPFATKLLAAPMQIRTKLKYQSTTQPGAWRLVTYVWRQTSRPSSPRHHVAGPSLDMDLLKAEIGGEEGLGTADVAEHC